MAEFKYLDEEGLRTLVGKIKELVAEVNENTENDNKFKEEAEETYAKTTEVDSKLEELQTIIAELQDTVKKLGMTKEEYATEVFNEFKNGGDIKLATDVTIETLPDNESLKIIKDSTIDLNNRTFFVSPDITQYGDTLPIAGCKVVIDEGMIKGNTKSASGGTILAQSGSDITLNNVTVTGVNPIYVYSGSKTTNVEINDCNILSDGCQAVYAEKFNDGKVIINGGFFKCEDKTPSNIDPNGNLRYLLNLKDGLRTPNTDKKPIDFIEVHGGTFVNFDPSDNYSEGEHSNYVPEGYKVTMEEKDGDRYYTVTPNE